MKLDLDRFYEFCSELVIDSKELGQMSLAKESLLTTQIFALEEIAKGLAEGIHWFIFLKGRQLGITTIMLALDLFWHFQHPGMQGTLAADGEDNRDMFRSTLTMYHDGLPRSHRIPVVQNNRNFISFKNRSRMLMQIAGGAKSKKGGKGRGKAITFIHATECSSWEDEESLASIVASLAETNPLRLQVFESTARGYNLFQEMWSEAKTAVSQRAIFIGWWLNRLYRKEKDTPEFAVYGRGALSSQEREWVSLVKIKYGFEIEEEQIAWWRWKLTEQIHDENLMMQEFPPTEDHAFILSGSNFFSVQKIEETAKSVALDDGAKFFRFAIKDDFMLTECEETIESMADLTVWEEPDDRGFYSIGGDPAFGSSDWADRFVIEVYRCYADMFDQVAEYCVTDLSTYKYAWILVYLAGAYKQSMINLEVNGPGQAVLDEMTNLRRRAAQLPSTHQFSNMTDVLAGMRYYLYRRPDSPGGLGAPYHWKTTQDTKERMLNGFRDTYYRNHMRIRSRPLLDEMRVIVRNEGAIEASGRAKDDRVIATGLSCIQYINFLKSPLEQMQVLYGAELERRQKIIVNPQGESAAEAAVSRNIRNFLQRNGIARAQ